MKGSITRLYCFDEYLVVHIVVHGFMHKSSRSANASRHLSLHMTQACHESPFSRLLVVYIELSVWYLFV